MRTSSNDFENLVAQALDTLPEWVQEYMSNVLVTVEPWPNASQLQAAEITPGKTLLGLYQGIPLTQRGRGYQLVPPDRISLFQGPLESYANNDLALKQLIRRTIIHEIAHHFGFSEEKLRELGV
ncbi:MAG: metallopeptidase family protein [Anaerolineae bacterium]